MNVVAASIVAESQWLAHILSAWAKLRTSVYSICQSQVQKIVEQIDVRISVITIIAGRNKYPASKKQPSDADG
jgi:hypothetical protein